MGELSNTTINGVSYDFKDAGAARQSHSHTKSQITDFPTLGTAAAKDVPSSGNASTSQVVMGNDSRLSDARTPTSHTHTKSQITDFPTSMPASDVSAWAKASTKPTYTQDEVSDGNTYKRVTSTEKTTWNSKGTYSKPSGGIPKTDLASAVQTSLGLADGALQHTTVSGSPDLDTYLTTGVYHITTSTATHAPTTNHATLFVDATVGTPYQIFKPDNVDSPWYTRHRSGSAWTAWAAMKFTDTTYSAATTSAAGLMSAADKTKLNGLPSTPSGFTKFSTLPNTAITLLDYGGFINYGPIVFFNGLVDVPSGENKKFTLFNIGFNVGETYPDNYPLPPIIATSAGFIQEGGFSVPVADSYTKTCTDCYLQVDCKIIGESRGAVVAYLIFDAEPTSRRTIGINCSYFGKKP